MKKASKQDKENVVVMAEFVLDTNAENKVDVEFWMTSGSDRSLDFLEDWASFHESLTFEGDKVNFTPHYVFWECDHCDDKFAAKNCYSRGKYCAVEPSDHVMTGREIIDEDLR